ncbi:MAG: response regulator transcription factor [Ardenticatenaceae bacterium]|nr:response regulator transcription factor [Anaerolineales bacterium]MCB8973781.1 response regulator transcription factor [Ardenticatenaceae bacterium]
MSATTYDEVPDVYVLDGRSLELLPALLNLHPLVPLLIVADELVETAVHSWLEQGVNGCISREAALPELLDAIRQTAAGEISLPSELTIRLIASMTKPSTAVPGEGLEILSKREQEVLTLLAEGFSNKQIAQHLYLSVRTVGNHLNSVYGKLNVHSRTEAALIAVQNNLPQKLSNFT